MSAQAEVTAACTHAGAEAEPDASVGAGVRAADKWTAEKLDPPPPAAPAARASLLPTSCPVAPAVRSSTAGQTCDDQDGAARGESRPCGPRGRPLFREPGTARQTLLEGNTLEWAVGRGCPAPPAPHAGPEVGPEEPAGEAPDRSWSLPPCAELRTPPSLGQAGRKPRPVAPVLPSGAGHQTRALQAAAAGVRGEGRWRCLLTSRMPQRPRGRSLGQGCPCPQPVPSHLALLGPVLFVGVSENNICTKGWTVGHCDQGPGHAHAASRAGRKPHAELQASRAKPPEASPPEGASEPPPQVPVRPAVPLRRWSGAGARRGSGQVGLDLSVVTAEIWDLRPHPTPGGFGFIVCTVAVSARASQDCAD